jgi:gliding motility-associated-like protein
MRYWVCIVLCFYIIMQPLRAQNCTGRKGHTPSTAHVICGNGTYNLAPSISCFNNSFFLPGCTNQNTSYGDLNPNYFRFNCNAAGTLAFTIAPRLPGDDINWQLFDITGKQPDDIYTNQSLSIAANWSGTFGTTGASAAGLVFFQCRSLATDGNINTFSPLIPLQQGHTYLLMVSNVSVAGDFALTMGGGTADISDSGVQQLQIFPSGCNNDEVELFFSKPVLCSSISPDASEISITPSVGFFQIAGLSCNNNNETESLRIRFAQTPPRGLYQLTINNGSDGNTFMDRCNNLLPVASNTFFAIQPYAVIDSVITDACVTQSVRVNFSKDILCSSIAADGSDFQISGPSSIAVSNAVWNCSLNTVKSIELKLTQPVQKGGSYLIVIKTGSDGNTIVDDCSVATPTGVQKTFTIPPTVNANFTFNLKEGCVTDTLQLFHAAANGETLWQWAVDTFSSNVQNPVFYLTQGGNYTIQLTTGNGICTASSQQSVVVNDKLVADFLMPVAACSGEGITIQNNSKAATAWLWDFGNGVTSILENPPVFQYTGTTDVIYTVSLSVSNTNCSATITKPINITSICNIYMPTAFTPNEDGLNDTFGPVHTHQLQNLQLSVFNRYGERVFSSSPTHSRWNGYWKGMLQPEGQYIWILSYADKQSGKTITRRGTVQLIL